MLDGANVYLLSLWIKYQIDGGLRNFLFAQFVICAKQKKQTSGVKSTFRD